MAVITPKPTRKSDAITQRNSITSKLLGGPAPAHLDNGDFAKYLGSQLGLASFSKSLPHAPATGLPDPTAFNNLIAALGLSTTAPKNVFMAVDEVPGGAGPLQTRKFVNPVAGLAYATHGGDPQQYDIPPAPEFAGKVEAAEIVENYWMALLRDVPFEEYRDHPAAHQAAHELTQLQAAAATPIFTTSGNVTPRTLFRGLGKGEHEGPYVSQFLLLPVPFGAQGFEQRNKAPLPRTDFLTRWDEWLAVQDGNQRAYADAQFDPNPRYLRDGRDLSNWVHVDVLFQAYVNACLILLQGPGAAPVRGGIDSKRSKSNPYGDRKRQQGFGTLGDPGHIAMMCEVASRALKAVWYQKWYVHLRLRPEEFGGRIHANRALGQSFPVDGSASGSDAVHETIERTGAALLPVAFPEGSPIHPAYGAGHATVAGACVTVLKALFKGSETIPCPVQVVVDPRTQEDRLVPWTGGPLTVEHELNKLASNIALGRNIAGVHWRSDGTASLRLGEQVAIDILRAHANAYAEMFQSDVVFHFNRFDGNGVTIKADATLM